MTLNPARLCLFLALLAGGLVLAEQPSADIERAIRDLGSRRFAIRQDATDVLWRAGEDARPALLEALESDDREVVYRARRLLERLRYGIRPETPKEVVRLIREFRDGDLFSQRETIVKLRDAGDLRAAMHLVKTIVEQQTRDQLMSSVFKQPEKTVARLLINDDVDAAAVIDWLELAASTAQGQRNLAVYLYQQGKADDRVAKLQARRADLSPQDGRLLYWLHRMRGDGQAAFDIARGASPENAGFDDLDLSLAYEAAWDVGNWTELAKVHDRRYGGDHTMLDGNPEYLGYAAAWHRLAGDTQRHSEVMDKLEQLSRKDPDVAWDCAEALLVNGRGDAAIEILSKARPAAAFRLLAGKSQYREAFKLAGIEKLDGPFDAWFRRATGEVADSEDAGTTRFDVALEVARALRVVGKEEDAIRGLTILARAAKQDADARKTRLRNVCTAARKAGLIDLACEHALLGLNGTNDRLMLQAVFDKDFAQADVWWRVFRRIHAGEPHEKTLGRLRSLLLSGVERIDIATMSEMVVKASSLAPLQPDMKPGEWYQRLAETCLKHKHRQLARELLRDATPDNPPAMLNLADLYAEDEEWAEAVAWYKAAWEASDQSNPLALYLYGRAMNKVHGGKDAGEDGEEIAGNDVGEAGDANGRSLMKVATLMPLASKARYDLAKGLQDRNLREEAYRQWELIVRSGMSSDWHANDAAKYLANMVSGKDNVRAAALWDRLLLSTMRRSASFVEYTGYLQLPRLIHKARGRGLLAAGETAAALQEIQRSLAVTPGDVGLAEDLVPELRAAGEDSEADRLFDAVYHQLETVCRDFPDSALHHNNLAWLAARCDRRLDDAIRHAQLAVKLAPDRPSYLDTLAEVCFRRGDFESAIRHAKACLKEEPDNQHFRQQVERFRAAQRGVVGS